MRESTVNKQHTQQQPKTRSTWEQVYYFLVPALTVRLSAELYACMCVYVCVCVCQSAFMTRLAFSLRASVCVCTCNLCVPEIASEIIIVELHWKFCVSSSQSGMCMFCKPLPPLFWDLYQSLFLIVSNAYPWNVSFLIVLWPLECHEQPVGQWLPTPAKTKCRLRTKRTWIWSARIPWSNVW